MTKNQIFREFNCRLSIEDTAKLCFKSVKTVTRWDKGGAIPPECKRLMRMYSGRELSPREEWSDFQMIHDRLVLPTGLKMSPEQVLTGAALLEVLSTGEIIVLGKLVRYARELAKRI
ncbi:DUF3653 domain-containing protein [Vibrio gallaecicus]|uniref:DUF3653 domain-containing protein n=1 Tax=Vibrio gallaecicus TaxID=552386 RepID=UPI0010C9FBAB|nr:DUF3653 domain-containing protein [Vibrio gallaecicus]MDN3617013.1 regulator [Vibrio gallaecicus]